MAAKAKRADTVAALLSNPQRWAQGAQALNRYEDPVVPQSAEAVKWCLTGAIERVYPQKKHPAIMRRLVEQIDPALAREFPEGFQGVDSLVWDIIAWWNDDDDRTHVDVLEAARKAKI